MHRALSWFGVGLAIVTGCSAEADPSSETAAAATEAPALDCSQIGGFPEAAMNGAGDATYVRAEPAPSNSMQSFTLGALRDIPGWGGKHADYTRDLAAPCMDIVAIGDGSGLSEKHELPMTSTACAGQRGLATVMMDNAALGAFIQFEDASNLPFGKDMYFVTGSQLDASGRVTAMCLSNAGTGDRFLMKRR